MPYPAERVSRLSTSDGYSHPSGPQLHPIQDLEVCFFDMPSLLSHLIKHFKLLTNPACHVLGDVPKQRSASWAPAVMH